MFDSDARGNADANIFGSLWWTNRQATTRQIRAVVAARNSHGQRQLSWAFGQSLHTRHAASPAAHPRDSCHRLQGPDQNASRATLRFGDYVQAFVHAVDEVHVGV